VIVTFILLLYVMMYIGVNATVPYAGGHIRIRPEVEAPDLLMQPAVDSADGTT
jgi:hypothetical protein